MVRTQSAWVADKVTGEVGVIVGRAPAGLMVIEGTSQEGIKLFAFQWLANPLSLRHATATDLAKAVLPARACG